MIRTLQLSREAIAFLAVTGVLSVAYLGLNTGDKGPRSQPVAPTFSVGKTMDVSITLITADSLRLACASDDAFGNAHCAFKYNGERWERGQGEEIIAPYMTVENQFLLVADLFKEPALQKRLQEEPPQGKVDELRRFNAHCKLKVEHKLGRLKVRWDNPPRGAWGDHDDANWFGRVSDCTVTDS
ncbi:MAG TPA: hypothetical protein VFS43_15185 [Polyangiaceae bacterium]|nr:hypothetical protein [Polyangiaceae bacterium]